MILRPASLLPALSQAFDAPLWPVGSLHSAGACYRVLWRLPGRDLHPREVRVFQDAPCLHSNAGYSRPVRIWLALTFLSFSTLPLGQRISISPAMLFAP